MFFLWRIEVEMPDDTWLSFLMTTPTRVDIQHMVRLAYPEGRAVRFYQIDPI